MTRISSKKLAPKAQNQMFFLFWKTLADLKTARDLEFLTNDLFSPVEKIMISKRFMIALLLHKGLSFRQICKVLRVSPNTVNSIARKINKNSRGYGQLMGRTLKNPQVAKMLPTFV